MEGAETVVVCVLVYMFVDTMNERKSSANAPLLWLVSHPALGFNQSQRKQNDCITDSSSV